MLDVVKKKRAKSLDKSSWHRGHLKKLILDHGKIQKKHLQLRARIIILHIVDKLKSLAIEMMSLKKTSKTIMKR